MEMTDEIKGMRILSPNTPEGFFLQVMRVIDDMEDEQIRKWQEEHRDD